MNWNTMNMHGEAPEDAFEDLCCHLFDLFGRREYPSSSSRFRRYRGAGGDGGVEAVWRIDGVDYSAVQAKWFPTAMKSDQKRQVKNSIDVAMRSHPDLKHYYVCLPRNLGGPKGDGKRSEEDYWIELITHVAENYPALQLHLWDDHRLTELLSRPYAVGIRGFWFNELTLSREMFSWSLEMQLSGWMRGRYMSDLHTRGIIQSKIESVTLPIESRAQIINELESLSSVVNAIAERLDFFLTLENRLSSVIISAARDLVGATTPVKQSIESTIECHALDMLGFGIEGLLEYMEKASKLVRMLKSIKYRDPCEASARKLARFIEDCLLEGEWGIRFDAPCYAGRNRLIILAGAGEGKTHALCAEACELIDSDFALPIMIRAAVANTAAGWESLIADALKVEDMVSGDSILYALEAAASLLDHGDAESELDIRGKVIVLVDGIDESANREDWLDLIRQAKAISAAHSRIRFVFSSRPAVFYKCEDKSIQSDTLHIYHDDGFAGIILDEYLARYRIELDQEAPIRRYLETPLQVKLFCSLNEGKKLGMCTGLASNVASLIGKQIDELEHEVARRTKCEDGLQSVHRVLSKCSKLLREGGHATYDELAVSQELRPIVASRTLDEALRILVEYGALSCFKEQADGFFCPARMSYEGGVQAFFDYIVAYDFVESCDNYQTVIMPGYLSGRFEALQYIAIMVYERERFLMTENTSFAECVASCSSELQFNCKVLANVAPVVAKSAVSVVVGWMSMGANELLDVVNNLICAVARMDGHPLGAVLLDTHLRSFPNPAMRDLVWSLPERFEFCWNGDICWHEDMVEEKYLRLSDCDLADGRPLVVAWHLSSLDSNRRELCESALVRWASIKPEEYLRLLNRMLDVDDPQVLESLFGVAAALSFFPDCPDDVLKGLAEMARRAILGDKQVVNASIRHHARIIAERAYQRGLIGENEVRDCRPPYGSRQSALPLSVAGMSGENNYGPPPMDYDRSRYVVCDPIQSGFFPPWHEGAALELTDAFLDDQAKRLGVRSLDAAQFCHCAVQGCIEKWGWAEQVFSFVEREGGELKSFGVDTAICQQFGQATHGQRSHIVTVGEKYVWCAKNGLMGYLADRLPYSIGYSDDETLFDYIRLDSYRIPFNYAVCNPGEQNDRAFFTPAGLGINREAVGGNCESVPQWVLDDDEYPFSSLVEGGLFADCPYQFNPVVLQAFYYEEAWGVERCIWISACAVSQAIMDSFEDKLNNEPGYARKFSDVNRLRAYVESECYITPQEVCSSPWRDEACSFVGDNSDEIEDDNSVLAYCSHVECTACVNADTDVYYTVPSKLFRELLGVDSCDGRRGFAVEGCCVFEYRKSGSIGSAVERQALYADNDLLDAALMDRQYELCWFIRVLKQDASDYSDHGGEGRFENDRLFFLKRVKGVFNVALISQAVHQPDEPSGDEAGVNGCSDSSVVMLE